jgi:hypothetical protein
LKRKSSSNLSEQFKAEKQEERGSTQIEARPSRQSTRCYPVEITTTMERVKGPSAICSLRTKEKSDFLRHPHSLRPSDPAFIFLYILTCIKTTDDKANDSLPQIQHK